MADQEHLFLLTNIREITPLSNQTLGGEDLHEGGENGVIHSSACQQQIEHSRQAHFSLHSLEYSCTRWL